MSGFSCVITSVLLLDGHTRALQVERFNSGCEGILVWLLFDGDGLGVFASCQQVSAWLGDFTEVDGLALLLGER